MAHLTPRAFGVGIATLAVTSVSAITAPSLAHGQPTPPGLCLTAGPTTTCTYLYTGATQTFPVPDGVTSVAVTAIGAHGGDNPRALGGRPDIVTGTLDVSGTETLLVEVGGNGMDPVGGGAGGYNGGGNAGGSLVPTTAAGAVARQTCGPAPPCPPGCLSQVAAGAGTSILAATRGKTAAAAAEAGRERRLWVASAAGMSRM
jgi:hypothetical protein